MKVLFLNWNEILKILVWYVLETSGRYITWDIAIDNCLTIWEYRLNMVHELIDFTCIEVSLDIFVYFRAGWFCKHGIALNFKVDAK